MDDSRIVRDLLSLALDELRRHNEGYHVHTPEAFLDLVDQALKTDNQKTLGAIYGDCVELLEQRRRGERGGSR